MTPPPAPGAIRLLLLLPILGAAAGWGVQHALLTLRPSPTPWMRVVLRGAEYLIASTAVLPAYALLLAVGLWAASRWPWPRMRRALLVAPLVHGALALAFVQWVVFGIVLQGRETLAGPPERFAAIAFGIVAVGYGYVGLGFGLLWLGRRLTDAAPGARWLRRCTGRRHG